MEKLKGIGVLKDISIGEAFLYIVEGIEIREEKDSIPFPRKEETLSFFIKKTKREIEESYKKAKEKKAKKESEIFNAHLLILEDPSIIEKVKQYLKEGFTLPYSVFKAFEESAKVIGNLKDEYLKERAKDIRDVCDRLLRNILNKPKPDLSHLPYPCIVVSEDLTPSDTINLDRKNVLGFATDKGSLTSHTAILAEALEIPAVVGLKEITKRVKNKDILILDGENGIVIVNPDDETIEKYREKKKEIEKKRAELNKVKFLPAITRSGKMIKIFANIGKPDEADMAIKNGAEGVGLFRTEFLFLDRDNPPSEDEQFEAYSYVLEKFGEKPVIIRTLDVGGDKLIPYLNLEKELNPFLGVRAIRLCLKRKDLFKLQLKAILRASVYGNVKIMYPMIAIKEEIIEANKVLDEAKEELRNEGKEFKDKIEVGIMVEIPSAALTADELIKYVDFFSIGTNDLIQYTFASDRTNDNVSYLYRPLSPAILKLIKMTVDASHNAGKITGVCGETAGDVNIVPELVKLGVDELSMSPQKIPEVKAKIREIS